MATNGIGAVVFDAVHGIGETDSLTVTTTSIDPMWRNVWYGLSAVSAGLGAYHGYKRNRGSIGWAVGWAVLGGIFPIITPAVAFAQGFGKPAKK